MGAGFECDIDGCPLCLATGLRECLDLGMRTPDPAVGAPTDDRVIPDNHTTHTGIGMGRLESRVGQRKRLRHEVFVTRCLPLGCHSDASAWPERIHRGIAGTGLPGWIR